MSSSSALRNRAALSPAPPDPATPWCRPCGNRAWRSCRAVPSTGLILQARHLNQDTIRALALDQRLNGAEFVDAALDDLDRLVDRLPHPIGDRRRRNGKPDQSAASIADLKAALAAGTEQAAEWLRQFAQLRQGILQIAILDVNLDAVRSRRESGIADPGFAQGAANVVANLVELVLLDRVGIDLEQDVRAALQVEAEHEATLRPVRPGLDRGFGEEIRNGAKAHRQRRQDDRQRLPPREIQHRVDPSGSEPCAAGKR